MQTAKTATNKGTLPMISLESKTIGTKDLQKVSAKYLDSLSESGPEVVIVGGVKRAVLVDYEQYTHLQLRFRELLTEVVAVSPLLSGAKMSEALEVPAEKLQATLKQIVAESTESSPFADLMDSIMSIALGTFATSVSAPAELKTAAQGRLARTAKQQENVSVRPKRNLTE